MCKLILYCFQKESINFWLYCCDWTIMDNKLKKLLLLTMHLNNSNILKMKLTTTKHIGLPMLATVCINIRVNFILNELIIFNKQFYYFIDNPNVLQHNFCYD